MLQASLHSVQTEVLPVLSVKLSLLCCSEFQQLKVLQSTLPDAARSEADACKTLIDAFTAWFAANCASQAGTLEDVTQVSLLCVV